MHRPRHVRVQQRLDGRPVQHPRLRKLSLDLWDLHRPQRVPVRGWLGSSSRLCEAHLPHGLQGHVHGAGRLRLPNRFQRADLRDPGVHRVPERRLHRPQCLHMHKLQPLDRHQLQHACVSNWLYDPLVSASGDM